jgi:predicted nucleotidyltransferase
MTGTSMPIQQVQDALATHPEIRVAIVFGSLASGHARRDSDVDVAVQAATPLDTAARMRLIEDIAAATGRPVDLVDLHTTGEPLLGQIVKHGHRLRGSDDDYAALLRRHVFDTEDFMPYVERMLKEKRQAWIG